MGWSRRTFPSRARASSRARSEEHTSELQSQSNLVCRLLLEKKKNKLLCAFPSSIDRATMIILNPLPLISIQFTPRSLLLPAPDCTHQQHSLSRPPAISLAPH